MTQHHTHHTDFESFAKNRNDVASTKAHNQAPKPTKNLCFATKMRYLFTKHSDLVPILYNFAAITTFLVCFY